MKTCKNCKWCSCSKYGYSMQACDAWIEDRAYGVYPASKTEITIEKSSTSEHIKASQTNPELCTTIAMEECAELIQAVSKAKRGNVNKENLAEEIADVLICIDWLKDVYDISLEDIDKWIDIKEKRIQRRLNEGFFR